MVAPVRSLVVAVVAVAVVASAPARAEHLPVHVYTTADGLANARVQGLARDRRGFLWFATHEGVSRFDGARFETFGLGDGLPALDATSALETSDGAIWIGTTGGLARLDPAARAARPRFTAVHLGADVDDSVTTIVEDREHVLWAGTEGGLWRLGVAGQPLAPARVELEGRRQRVYAIAQDPAGSLWLGMGRGVIRRTAAGVVSHYAYSPHTATDDRILRVLVDRAGVVWIGGIELGLVALRPPAPDVAVVAADDSLWEAAGRAGPARGADGEVRVPAEPGALVRYTEADGFTHHGVRRGMCQDSTGALYFGSTTLVRFDGHRFTQLDPSRGFPEDSFAPCVEDVAGNLWFGGDQVGVVRLSRRGFVTYRTGDGLAGTRINGISEGPDGELYVTALRDVHTLHRLDGDRFVAVEPRVAPADRGGAWGWGQVGFLDRDRRWWYATQLGLARYPEVARLEDLATTLPRFWHRGDDGLPGRDIWRLYQDRAGDVWISTLSADGLARWDRARDALAPVIDPALPAAAVDAFAEDAHGQLWLGYNDGAVVALDAEHHVARRLAEADGLLPGAIEALLVDRAGRLWIASEQGVVRIEDPRAPHPRFVRYTHATGLSSVAATALVDDERGYLYVGTNRGIDRIDPTDDAIAHYTLLDGLAQEYVDTAFRDRAGRLWFGSHGGLSRLQPDDRPAPAPAPVYVLELRVGGEGQPLAAGGDRHPLALALPYDAGAIDLAVASPSMEVGQPVRYQYRLAADAPWSAPQASGELHFPRLEPGRYAVEIRATYDGGRASPITAIAIAVAAPLWQRAWFRLAVLAAIVGLAWFAYRRRVAHLLALERVRARLASDLHDDLGANLSRIAILSELAARRDAEGARAVVGDIGASARALIDATSDIVWATDPRKDDLGSLLARLRAFAGDVLDAKGIGWSLDAPPEPARVPLDPDARRHLFLVVKEAITNAARHADPRHVSIAIRVRATRLEAIVEDDGRGIDPTPRDTRGGNGLRNMAARAEQAGGSLAVEAIETGGTRITLRLPLAGRGISPPR